MASPEPAAQSTSLAATEQEGSPQPQPQEPVPKAAAGVPEAEADKVEGAGVEEEEEEEGECGFSLFMKAGGCRDAFVAWVEAAQKDGNDIGMGCHEATVNLMKCVDAHADYYAPVLRAEEAFSEICAQARAFVERVD